LRRRGREGDCDTIRDWRNEQLAELMVMLVIPCNLRLALFLFLSEQMGRERELG